VFTVTRANRPEPQSCDSDSTLSHLWGQFPPFSLSLSTYWSDQAHLLVNRAVLYGRTDHHRDRCMVIAVTHHW